MLDELFSDATLRKVEGTWALFFEDEEYVRLLDAQSREDAEKQLREMLCLPKQADYSDA